MSKNYPVIIAVEGLDLTGKTTLLSGLAALLAQANVSHQVVRSPGGTALGQKIRTIYLEDDYTMDEQTSMMLMLTDRVQLVKEVLQTPKSVQVILLDRYRASTIAYNCQDEAMRTLYLKMEKLLEIPLPHASILLDAPIETLAKRRRADEHNRLDSAKDTYRQAVRDSYLEQFQAMSNGHVINVDAEPHLILKQAYEVVIDTLTHR